MTPEQMQERRESLQKAMQELQEQFAARMNYMVGQVALLDEMLKEPAQGSEKSATADS